MTTTYLEIEATWHKLTRRRHLEPAATNTIEHLVRRDHTRNSRIFRLRKYTCQSTLIREKAYVTCILTEQFCITQFDDIDMSRKTRKEEFWY
jgi:hypothetical protein